jgi:hypothetical protein
MVVTTNQIICPIRRSCIERNHFVLYKGDNSIEKRQ